MTTESKRREALAQQLRATMQPRKPSPLGAALANSFLYAIGASVGYGIYTLEGIPQALLIGGVAVFLISLVMSK